LSRRRGRIVKGEGRGEKKNGGIKNVVTNPVHRPSSKKRRGEGGQDGVRKEGKEGMENGDLETSKVEEPSGKRERLKKKGSLPGLGCDQGE